MMFFVVSWLDGHFGFVRSFSVCPIGPNKIKFAQDCTEMTKTKKNELVDSIRRYVEKNVDIRGDIKKYKQQN